MNQVGRAAAAQMLRQLHRSMLAEEAKLADRAQAAAAGPNLAMDSLCTITRCVPEPGVLHLPVV